MATERRDSRLAKNLLVRLDKMKVRIATNVLPRLP
jgi:hypothetical protein